MKQSLHQRRRRVRVAVFALAAVVLLFATQANAAHWYVDLGGNALAFSPDLLTVQPGDAVTFVNKGGYHNVVADDGSFRCAHGCDADGGNGNASLDFWVATITLSTPGTVGYFCEPHGAPGVGMFGTIIVAAPEPAPVHAVPGAGPLFELLLAGTLIAAGAWRLLSRSGARRRAS